MQIDKTASQRSLRNLFVRITCPLSDVRFGSRADMRRKKLCLFTPKIGHQSVQMEMSSRAKRTLVGVIDTFVESSPSGNARIGMRVHPGNNFWPNYGPSIAPKQNP
jgi:hypothetical protein